MNLSSRHSCLDFSVYEVVRVACLSRSWYSTETSHANDLVNSKSHAVCREKPLLKGYELFLNTDRVSCCFEVI